MVHDHDHTGGHLPTHGKAFAVSVALNVAFVVIEVVYGLLAGSTALVADAAHNAGDVLGLGLAWGAAWLAKVDATRRHTYGWRKSTVVAAVLNALIIVLTVGAVGWEAIGRFFEPVQVEGVTMIVVAGIGVGINGVSALMFWAGRDKDMNIQGAFMHLVADAAVSVGVVIAGIAVVFTGYDWIDPATTLAISVVIIAGTWGLLRESFSLLLDAVPSHIDPAKVRETLLELPGVWAVHDLHVWALSTNETSLTAHLATTPEVVPKSVIDAIDRIMRERFGITHVTVQLEAEEIAAGCRQDCDDPKQEH